MNTFFICGTPRSRTAWLANLLTTDKSHCFHELFAESTSINDMQIEFLKTGKSVVGNSDSANAFFIDEIKKTYPKTKIVVIKRNAEEVIDSLLNYGIGFENYSKEQLKNAMEIIIKKIEYVEKNYNCISFNYFELQNPECCRKIFEYCTDSLFDYKRWQLLSNLNIQADKEYKKKQIDCILKNQHKFHFIKN